MKIIKVKVSNYRNLVDVEVNLNAECNYLIGENNLGKSNFLGLLATVCSGRAFEDKDFADSANPNNQIRTKFWDAQIGRIKWRTFGKLTGYSAYYSSAGTITNGYFNAFQWNNDIVDFWAMFGI